VGSEIGRDVARQAANVVGALFQMGMTAAASTTIQGVVDEGPRSLVEPALYAFTIWALIFVLTGQGQEAIRRDLPAIFEAEGTLKRHLALNPRMAGDGDEAEVSYVLLVVEGEERPAVGATALIRDELRRVGDRWLVVRHKIEVDPSINVYERG
jgi:hypothetical protein